MPSALNTRLIAVVIALTVSIGCLAADATAPAKSAAFVAGMTKLGFLHGSWQVQPWQRTSKTADLTAGTPYPLSFQPFLSERYLRASGNQDGVDFELTLSFDERSGSYRLSLLDSATGVLDIYNGQFLDSGKLRMENDHGWRFEFEVNSEHDWALKNYYSKDGGTHWLHTATYLFRRM